MATALVNRSNPAALPAVRRTIAAAAGAIGTTSTPTTSLVLSSPGQQQRNRQQQRRTFLEQAGSDASKAGSAGAGPGGRGAIPTYFQRERLPANTVIRFVPQQTAWVVERMGKFHRILEPGLAILVPFLDRIAYVKSLKEVAIEIPSQSAITADNVTLELDGVLYTRVFDAYKARLVLFYSVYYSTSLIPGFCLSAYQNDH